jgi:hypothetical protein
LSSSVCLQYHYVISLILLLRIRLTRRGGICWSEPRGVPRPAYDGEGYASPSLEASQDWHDALEAMLDEEYVPEGVNLVQERSNPAQQCISRPSLGVIRTGPGIPAWPSRNNIIRPSREDKRRPGLQGKAAQPAYWPGREPEASGPAGRWRRPSRNTTIWPSRGTGGGRGAGRREPSRGSRPSRGSGGLTGRRPIRDAEQRAQPGGAPAQPGQRDAGLEEVAARPGLLLACAGPCGLIPAWGLL